MERIQNKSELKQVLEQESQYYIRAYANKKEKALLMWKKDLDVSYIWSWLKSLRKAEYYKNCKSRKLIHKLLYLHFERKKNKLGSRLQFSISDNVLGRGAVLYHPGVVINPNANIGSGCMFHGNNCVGNKGKGQSGAPKIGNGVEFGFGAVVIGDVEIADNIKIGANAVVTQSFLEEGIIIAGVPAKKLVSGGK